MAFIALWLGVMTGGLAYKLECVQEGKVTQFWTFRWDAPVPYLFRPEQDGCVTHTGTRVALNTVGIAEYEKTTPTLVARKYAESTDGTDSADFIQLREATSEYMTRNERVDTVSASEASVVTYLGQLEELNPPDRYADAHADLLAAVKKTNSCNDRIRDAITADDRRALGQVMDELRDVAADVQAALAQIDRLRASQ